MEFKLSDIPCETEVKSPIGERISQILKKIDFPNRDKFIFKVQLNGMNNYYLEVYAEVVNKFYGLPLTISHSRHTKLSEISSDKEIVREIFILVGQVVIHEFAECFRYDSKIAYDPHEGNRNELMFKAVEALTEPVKSIFHAVEFVPITFTLPFDKDAKPFQPKPEKPKHDRKPPKNTGGFAKFFHDDKFKYRKSG